MTKLEIFLAALLVVFVVILSSNLTPSNTKKLKGLNREISCDMGVYNTLKEFNRAGFSLARPERIKLVSMCKPSKLNVQLKNLLHLTRIK